MYLCCTFHCKCNLTKGIILYFVSKQNTHTNWASDIGDFNHDWMTRYIYSLYFASTTLTTVGYGDITPQNVIEILSILFIQIFGTLPLKQELSTLDSSLMKSAVS
jgi:Ion channel